ncbi:MAG: hypothetical protein AB9835_02630 [Eubacteriales bacterium]
MSTIPTGAGRGASMNFTKFLSLIMALLLVAAAFPFTVSAADTPSASPNDITIASPTPLTSYTGWSQGIKYTLYNNTQSRIENVTVSIQLPDGVVQNGSVESTQTISIEAGSMKDVSFEVLATEVGTYNIGANVTWPGLTGSKSYNVALNVMDIGAYNPQPGRIIFESVDIPTRVTVGGKFEVKLNIKNVGDIGAGTVVMNFSGNEYFINTSPSNSIINNLLAGQSFTQTYTIEVLPNATIGYNNITFNVSYAGSTISQQAGIYVDAVEPPVYEISASDIPKQITAGGGNFNLTVQIKNTGAATENTKLIITPPAGMTSKTANTVYIPKIVKDQTITRTFTFSAPADMAEGFADFKVNVESADGLTKKEYMTGLLINKGTSSSSDISIISATFPDSGMKGDKVILTLQLKNTGSDASNVKVSVTPPAGAENTSADIITIASIKAGESVERTFEYILTDSMKAGYNSFEIAVSNGSASVKQYAGLTVKNRPAPAIDISNIDIPAQVSIGQDFKVKMTIKNNGGKAENVKLTVTPPTGMINKSGNIVQLDVLESGATTTAEFVFTPTSTASSGFNAFNVEIAGGDNTSTRYFGTLLNSENKGGIEILSVTLPKSAQAGGAEFNMVIKLRNNSTAKQKVKLSVTPPAGVVEKSASLMYVDIAAGETIERTITYYASKAAADSFNTFEVKAGTDENNMVSQFTGLLVSNPQKAEDPSGSKDIPVLIIDRYSYGDEAIYGSKSFILELDFLNTNKTEAIKDLKITISSDSGSTTSAGGVFTPVSSSNTFFIDYLDPGQSVTKTIELFVKSDVAPSSYGVNVNFTYKNSSGEAANSSEVISIPVQQEVRFNIGEVPYIYDVPVGSEAYTNISFGNLGKSVIYNVIVKVEGEGFVNSEGEYYAGNLDAGKHVSKDFYLTPTMGGMVNGKFIFMYEDASGNKQQVEKPFSFNAIEQIIDPGKPGDIPIDPGMPGEEIPIGEEIKEGLPTWSWFAMGGGVLVVAALVAFFVIRAKRMKGELGDEEL